MKKIIKVIDTDKKVHVREVKVRDFYLVEVRHQYKSTTFKPKKGKGSFVRNKRCNEEW
jgi:stalled ribosome alternative rescue factor ArfA